MPTPPGIVAVKCKGCGQPAFLFTEAGDWGPAGSVGHSKPTGTERRSTAEPSRVRCSLYHQLSSYEFFSVHSDAERLPDPEAFIPHDG